MKRLHIFASFLVYVQPQRTLKRLSLASSCTKRTFLCHSNIESVLFRRSRFKDAIFIILLSPKNFLLDKISSKIKAHKLYYDNSCFKSHVTGPLCAMSICYQLIVNLFWIVFHSSRACKMLPIYGKIKKPIENMGFKSRNHQNVINQWTRS